MIGDFGRQPRWTTVGVVGCLMLGVWHLEALVIRPMVIHPTFRTTTTTLTATRNDADPTTTPTSTATPVLDNSLIKAAVLAAWKDDSIYSQQMDVPPGFFALFHAIKSSGIALGLRGTPMVFRKEELPIHNFEQFFTMKDLAKAVEDDFLDAAKGSTDNRKGWKVRKNKNTLVCW